MKTMPTSMFRLLTGQENPFFIWIIKLIDLTSLGNFRKALTDNEKETYIIWGCCFSVWLLLFLPYKYIICEKESFLFSVEERLNVSINSVDDDRNCAEPENDDFWYISIVFFLPIMPIIFFLIIFFTFHPSSSTKRCWGDLVWLAQWNIILNFTVGRLIVNGEHYREKLSLFVESTGFVGQVQRSQKHSCYANNHIPASSQLERKKVHIPSFSFFFCHTQLNLRDSTAQRTPVKIH